MSRSAKSIAGAFSPALVICLILIAVASFAGMGVLAAYEPDLRSGKDGGSHSLSSSSDGYAALTKLLSASGDNVMLSRRPLDTNSDSSLQILTPRASTRHDAIEEIRHDGAVLVVLPKWETQKHPVKRGWVFTGGVIPKEFLRTTFGKELADKTTLSNRSGKHKTQLYRPDGSRFGAPVTVDQLRTISGPDWIPVLVDDNDAPVLVMNRDDRTYVLSEPDLLNTQGIKSLDNARTGIALLHLINPEDNAYIFDLTLNGFVSERNILRMLLSPPLLGMSLVLIVLAAFAGYQAIIRFGPQREHGRALVMGKSGLADNTAGLVRLARREHKMAAPYAQLTRMAVARAIGAPRRLSEDELQAFLDRVSKTTGASTTFTALDQQARAAQTPGDLMQVAVALYRWNQELTRGRQ